MRTRLTFDQILPGAELHVAGAWRKVSSVSGEALCVHFADGTCLSAAGPESIFYALVSRDMLRGESQTEEAAPARTAREANKGDVSAKPGGVSAPFAFPFGGGAAPEGSSVDKATAVDTAWVHLAAKLEGCIWDAASALSREQLDRVRLKMFEAIQQEAEA